MNNKEILICKCNSDEHQYLVYYSNDEYPMVYIHPHLIKRSFWYRLKYGLKYIFGYKTQYGAWDEFIINPDDVDKIENIVKFLKKDDV
jgi:hypothetical protein